MPVVSICVGEFVWLSAKICVPETAWWIRVRKGAAAAKLNRRGMANFHLHPEE
jgi:hypothetical protein